MKLDPLEIAALHPVVLDRERSKKMKPYRYYITVGAWTLIAAFILGAPALTAGQNALKLPPAVIPEALTVVPKSVDVLGSRMTYLEMGAGDPVLFIHGNPTSSYLWRNIMPYVAKGHRAVAVDLIGMGGSGKPDIAYTFENHYRYFSQFINSLGLKKVTLVGHDWGATLAWEYARRNPARVRRLAFMEGVLPPMFPFPSFEAMGPEMEKMFRAFKDPVEGPRVVMDENMFHYIQEDHPDAIGREIVDWIRRN